MRRTRSMWMMGAAALFAVAVHCGSSFEANSGAFAGADDGPCATVYKGLCGKPCANRDEDCAAGLYCGADGRCTAECASGHPCGSGFFCSSRGRCTSMGLGTTTPASEAGPPEDGGIVPTDVVCADIDVELTKLVPKVLFLLDQSSSMHYEKFPSGSSNECANGCRWTELKRVLIGPDNNRGGLIKQLESEAEIAVEMYSATDKDENDGDDSFLDASAIKVQNTCPRFNGRAFDGLTFSATSYPAVEALLRPATVDDDTPTGPAIREVVGLTADGGVRDGGLASIASATPKVLVLVTDGEPMECGESSPTDAGAHAVVAAVRDTYKHDIRTFVIAIGSPSTHFDQVARAGQGLDIRNGDASAIRPDTTSELVSALTKIVLGARTCTFDLKGAVEPGAERLGTVALNGEPVPFDEPGAPEEGWKLLTPSRIELVGSACEKLKSRHDAVLTARFPCGAIKVGGPTDPK